MTSSEVASLESDVEVEHVERPEAAFFAVCNARDFIALVALINSIRAVGHREPIYVTDCGLSSVQRQILDPHVTLLPGPQGYPAVLLKTQGALSIDPDVAIILDADVILTRPLTDLIGEAPVFFRDPLGSRFHSGWSRLDLGPLRRGPYVNGGHYIIPRVSGLLPRFRTATERMLEIIRREPEAALSTSGSFYLLEQDVLAALIGTLRHGSYIVSEEAAYWPFHGECKDARLLHHIIFKPWLTRLRPNLYTQQMTELLMTGPVLVPREQVPRFLQRGLVGDLDRQFRSVCHGARETFRGRLGIRRGTDMAPAASLFAALDGWRTGGAQGALVPACDERPKGQATSGVAAVSASRRST